MLDGRELYAGASIGISVGEHRTESPEDLLRNADTAMYEAKSEAASDYRVFDPSCTSGSWAACRWRTT